MEKDKPLSGTRLTARALDYSGADGRRKSSLPHMRCCEGGARLLPQSMTSASTYVLFAHHLGERGLSEPGAVRTIIEALRVVCAAYTVPVVMGSPTRACAHARARE